MLFVDKRENTQTMHISQHFNISRFVNFNFISCTVVKIEIDIMSDKRLRELETTKAHIHRLGYRFLEGGEDGRLLSLFTILVYIVCIMFVYC